jgi:hypothetical protein
MVMVAGARAEAAFSVAGVGGTAALANETATSASGATNAMLVEIDMQTPRQRDEYKK